MKPQKKLARKSSRGSELEKIRGSIFILTVFKNMFISNSHLKLHIFMKFTAIFNIYMSHIMINQGNSHNYWLKYLSFLCVWNI